MRGSQTGRGRDAVVALTPVAVITAVAVTVFPVPAGVALQGVVLGLLNALVAVGMTLLYRANRILNFAQGELGTAPAVLAVALVAYGGWNYGLAVGSGLVAAVALGALVELVVIRRFGAAPRLVLTVATIGLAQLLAIGATAIPGIWGERPASTVVHFPLHWRFTVEPIVFSADHVLALVVAPLALAAVALLLRYSTIGIAIRASAERADLANLLGVRVSRLQTVVWSLAALLSFLGVFLRAGILGLPATTTALHLSVLLVALAALTMGNLGDLRVITLSAVALGLLEQGVAWNHPRNPELVDPVIAAVTIACLLTRRLARSTGPAEVSSWRFADDVRPTPRALLRTPEVRGARIAGGVLLAVALVAAPQVLGPGDREKATALVIFTIIAVSLVVLAGWAGQISLGQMAFVGFGAAVGAYATRHWGLDLSLAVLLSGTVGAAIALVVGLPALRLRGLFLAATSLAFSLATTTFLLNSQHFGWVPADVTVVRPKLFGAVDLEDQATYYYVCLAYLGLAVGAVRGIRHSRLGRSLLALRENPQGAEAFGINATRAKLCAFAISGFLAAGAGCLFAHLLGGFSPDSYSPYESFTIFIAVVVGGIGSLLGACLGALFLLGGRWFLPGAQWQGLVSASGVLVVLWVIPGGLADVVYRVRDAGLRWVARRHAAPELRP